MAPVARALPKVLRLPGVSVLSSASMGPAYSLASTMGPMVAAAGAATPLALIAISGVMLCIAVAFAFLSRVAPNAGSSYAWIRMAFGNGAGAYGAWLLLLSNFFATMAIATPAAIYTLDLFAPAYAQHPFWDAVAGAVWIVASAMLLYAGIRPTAVVTAVAIAAELGVLAAAALAAVVAPYHAQAAATSPQNVHVAALTLTGFLNAMTLGIWMTDGWEVSAATSEEVDGDAATSGLGGVAGLLITTVTLALCMVAYLHLGSVAGFAANQADSMRYVADLLGGGAWRIAIVSTVLISTCSTLWTTVLYLSRSVYAMGRDGLLPRSLGRLDARCEPLWSLAAIALLVSVCELLTGFSPTVIDVLNGVLSGSSIFLGLLFALTAAAAARTFWNDLRERAAAAVVPLAGVVALGGLIIATIALGVQSLRLFAIAGLVLGVPFAAWTGRRIGDQRVAEMLKATTTPAAARTSEPT
jgi:amino acid transporter